MGIIYSKNYSIRKELFNKIFIQNIWKLFIQKIIHFFEKLIIAQGYFQVLPRNDEIGQEENLGLVGGWSQKSNGYLSGWNGWACW